MNKLNCKNLSKSFVINNETLDVLIDINLEIEESEKIAILSTQDLEAATFTAAHIIENVTGEKVLSYLK